MKNVRRSEGEPHDRLTSYANEMLKTLDQQPGGPKLKGMVLLWDNSVNATAVHGFEDDAEAIAQMFVHLAAIFEANGQKLVISRVGAG